MKAYDRDYFERGVELGISGYNDYRWLPDLTLPLAHEIVTQLGLRKSDRILDFGCAKGYLVKALRMLHFEAWGVDVSEYALAEAAADVRSYLFSDLRLAPTPVDLVVAKDVLEHLTSEALETTLPALRRACRRMLVIVPLGNGERYTIPEYEKDVTHVIREPLSWWCKTFAKAGFFVDRATYAMPHIKENWAHYERGNGFFLLESS